MQETNLSNFDNKIIWFLVYNLSNNVLKYFAFKNMLYAWWDIALYCKVFKHLRKTLIHCFHILCRLNKNYILQYNIYMLNFSFSSDNTIFERKLCIEKYWYKISFSLKCITKRYFHDITNMINPPYYYCAKTVIGSCYILHIKYLHYTFLKNENIGNTIPHPSLII